MTAPDGRPCPACGKRFPDKKSLRRHREAEHPVACPACGRSFVTAEGVALHAQAVHGAPPAAQAAGDDGPPTT